MEKIAILGAGTWGTALARVLALAGHEVAVWSALPMEVRVLDQERVHPKLPEVNLPETITFTADIKAAITGKAFVFIVVPSVFVRDTARLSTAYLTSDQVVVTAAKGIENGTFLTMSGVIMDEFKKYGPDPMPKIVALSGPTHAEEVAKDVLTTIVSASEDEDAAKKVQALFEGTCIRAYTNHDIEGVEICGALKNVIALAAGISVGMGCGDNTKAALIVRGMAEITRLGRAMGCTDQVFYGLAGIGDLIVTAMSRHSRNNKCGQLIGEGYAPEEAIHQVGMVVEGINCLPAAMALSEKYDVDMPIVHAVYDVINDKISAFDAVNQLMKRDTKSEEPYPCLFDRQLI